MCHCVEREVVVESAGFVFIEWPRWSVGDWEYRNMDVSEYWHPEESRSGSSMSGTVDRVVN